VYPMIKVHSCNTFPSSTKFSQPKLSAHVCVKYSEIFELIVVSSNGGCSPLVPSHLPPPWIKSADGHVEEQGRLPMMISPAPEKPCSRLHIFSGYRAFLDRSLESWVVHNARAWPKVFEWEWCARQLANKVAPV
jgi:hypothetical protein